MKSNVMKLLNKKFRKQLAAVCGGSRVVLSQKTVHLP